MRRGIMWVKTLLLCLVLVSLPMITIQGVTIRDMEAVLSAARGNRWIVADRGVPDLRKKWMVITCYSTLTGLLFFFLIQENRRREILTLEKGLRQISSGQHQEWVQKSCLAEEVTKVIEDVASTLVKEKSLSELIMDNINSGVVVLDNDQVIISCNRAAERIIGLARDSLIGRNYSELVQQLIDRPSLLSEIVNTENPCSNREVELRTPRGRLNILVDRALVRDREGCILGIVTIFRDITDQKLLEEQVRRAEKLSVVGQLAAGTAHEIRNPLTSVKGFIQLLRARFAENDPAQEYISIMTSEIDRINSIIQEFLLLAKPSAPSFRLVDLHAVLDEISLLVESEALLKNVQVHKEYSLGLPLLKIDKEQMKQVFLNLITNSIAAMPDGGHLTMRTAMEDERNLVVVIEDTGSGIPAENLERIFEPFFTSKDQGTGLGLTVSYGIVQNHGGVIKVDSKVGEGSRFSVLLPVTARGGPP